MFRKIFFAFLYFLTASTGAWGQQFRNFDAALNDFCYSPVTDKIYGVRNGLRANGNAVVMIDPGTGEETGYIPVGSEPAVVRVSDNGRYLYIVLFGAPYIKCYDLTTQQFVTTIDLEQVTPINQWVQYYPFNAADLVPLPPNGTSIVMSRFSQQSTPGFQGMAVYDGDTPRPDEIGPGVNGGDRLALSSDGVTVWGLGHSYQPTAFFKYQITPQGLQQVAEYPGLITQDVRYLVTQNDRIYLQNGQIFDVSSGSPVLLATLPIGQNFGYNPSPMTPAIDEAVIYQVSQFDPSNPFGYSGTFLNKYDKNTFQFLGKEVITDWNLFSNPEKIVSLGQGRVAMSGIYQGKRTFELFNPAPCAAVNLSLAVQSDRLIACEGDTITLNAAPGYSAYYWSNGMQGQSIRIHQGNFNANDSVFYRVKMPDGCLSQPSAKVVPGFQTAPTLYELVLENYRYILCPDQSAGIFPSTSGAAYVLCTTTGDTLPQGQYYYIREEGTYSFQSLSSAGCRSNMLSVDIYEAHPNDQRPVITPVGPLSYCSNTPTLLQVPAGSDFRYQWSNGDTTGTVIPRWPGNYFVKKAYNDGCMSLSSDTLHIDIKNVPPVLQVRQVFGQLLAEPLSNVGDSLQWYLNGQAVAGAVANTLTPTENGFYTVKNISDGCHNGQSPPFVYPHTLDITLSAYGGGSPVTAFDLYAQVSPLSNFYTYQWNNGVSEAWQFGVGEGVYCVTITDTQFGYTGTRCVEIVPNDALSMEVFPHNEGIMMEVSAQINNVPVALDTLLTGADGKVLFTGLEQGNYYIRAIPQAGTPEFSLYLPTYFYSAALWTDASTPTIAGLRLLDGAPPQLLLPMLYAGMLTGPGGITGILTDGDGFQAWTADGGSNSLSGAPIAGAGVFLYNANGQPIQHTYTNSNGMYGFYGLPPGTYTVVVNIPGVPPASVTVTLTSTHLTNVIHFTLQNGQFVTAATEAGALVWSLSPNPTDGWVRLMAPQTVFVQVRNALGQPVGGVRQVNGAADIDLGKNPAGIYTIEIRDEQGRRSQKKLVRR